MCWQLTISISQIIAAGINRGMIDINSSFAYRFPIGFQLTFPALVLLFWWFVPESPRWLIRKGQNDKAVSAVRVLHREDKSYDCDGEVNALQADVARQKFEEAESGWLQLITDPVERRKVIFSAGALIAQQVNGIQWFYYFGTFHLHYFRWSFVALICCLPIFLGLTSFQT